MSSFLSQYGIRLSTKDFETVSWDEFKSLLTGIDPETALGRVVAIRAEKDKEVLKRFTPEQRRIHDDWQKRNAEIMSEKKFDEEMAALEAAFARAFG